LADEALAGAAAAGELCRAMRGWMRGKARDIASAAGAALAAGFFATAASAQTAPALKIERPLNAITFYGGVSTPSRFYHAVCCVGLGRTEKDYSFSVAVNRRLTPVSNGLSLEGELGYSRRFGLSRTNEFWGAGVLRYEGFPWDAHLVTTIGGAVGLSYADRVPDIERREALATKTPTSATFVYLGPEITFALPQRPDIALVLRVMHRSGWYPVFTKSNTASNMMTVGLRIGF
jgi:hypothetical protein